MEEGRKSKYGKRIWTFVDADVKGEKDYDATWSVTRYPKVK